MKTFFIRALSALTFTLLVCSVSATKITVTVANYTFSPANFSAKIGDTVEWVWSAGSHTTTSTSVPAGALSWNNNINSSLPTFMYKITTAGTYQYQCNFHVGMGMTGTFTVSALGIKSVLGSTVISAAMYPNPANEIVNLTYNTTAVSDVQIAIYNEQGKLADHYSGNNLPASLHLQEIPVYNLPGGIYYCIITAGDAESCIKFVVIK